MIQPLQDKKVIFFDIGNTLDRPASGDWMLTNRFLEEAGSRLRDRSEAEIMKGMEPGFRFLVENHHVTTVEEEIIQFTRFYALLSDALNLGLTEEQASLIARDRACNMENYVPCPGIIEVLETLSQTHRIGVISDTWPSVGQQLDYLGISRFISFRTFSCDLGVFKPDPRMYLDALSRSGASAGEAVFIDDSPRNLEGAAALGITPILIEYDPVTDLDTPYLRIKDLRELIR